MLPVLKVLMLASVSLCGIALICSSLLLKRTGDDTMLLRTVSCSKLILVIGVVEAALVMLGAG